jgi:hypothetical protein
MVPLVCAWLETGLPPARAEAVALLHLLIAQCPERYRPNPRDVCMHLCVYVSVCVNVCAYACWHTSRSLWLRGPFGVRPRLPYYRVPVLRALAFAHVASGGADDVRRLGAALLTLPAADLVMVRGVLAMLVCVCVCVYVHVADRVGAWQADGAVLAAAEPSLGGLVSSV